MRMTIRANGGIINNQTLTGRLRFFKMTGPFSWTVSDGTVNLPVLESTTYTPSRDYLVVGRDRPVPNSAAEIALREIGLKADIVIISLRPALYGNTTEIHFACSATAFGWGSDVPDYNLPPANVGEDLTAAAPQMQAAVRALGIRRVYTSIGATPSSTTAPVTANANLGLVTVVEVPFALA